MARFISDSLLLVPLPTASKVHGSGFSPDLSTNLNIPANLTKICRSASITNPVSKRACGPSIYCMDSVGKIHIPSFSERPCCSSSSWSPLFVCSAGFFLEATMPYRSGRQCPLSFHQPFTASQPASRRLNAARRLHTTTLYFRMEVMSYLLRHLLSLGGCAVESMHTSCSSAASP